MPRLQGQNPRLFLDSERELSSLANNLRAARLRRKLSLKELAQSALTSVSTLIRLERGDSTVAVGTVLQVMSILGLVRGVSELASPENDVAQVLSEVRNLRLKKNTSAKKIFSDEERNF